MFNILVTSRETAWETDQLMRMDVGRFGEYSGAESEGISVNDPSTLKLLEKIDTLLMYEEHSKSANVDVVRYGRLRGIKRYFFVIRGELCPISFARVWRSIALSAHLVPNVWRQQ